MESMPARAAAKDVTAFYTARRNRCPRFKAKAKELRFEKNTGGTSGELNKAEMLAALASWDSKIYQEEEVLKEAIYKGARDHEDGRGAADAAAAAAAADGAAAADAATRAGASGRDGAGGAGADGAGTDGAGADGAGTGGAGADGAVTGSARGSARGSAGGGGEASGAFDPEDYNPGLLVFDHEDGLQAVKTWPDCYLAIAKYICQKAPELELPSDPPFEAALASSLHDAITVGILNVSSVVSSMRLWKPPTVQQTAGANSRATWTFITVDDRCRLVHLLTEHQLARVVSRFGEGMTREQLDSDVDGQACPFNGDGSFTCYFNKDDWKPTHVDPNHDMLRTADPFWTASHRLKIKQCHTRELESPHSHGIL
ncbi:hypothetical protein M885DRAFT_601617 [Pelagophyceae sp. CCMP2097]|nr:hypothetical protein M885DRAFT_601617 [Pelagophyceae sp. CCMP2097]